MVRSQVMIIDENSTHQKLASLMAQRFGCVPIVVTGVEEAVHKLSCNPDVHIVLIDMEIPRSLNGLKCLRALVRFRKLKRLGYAIVASSAHAMPEDLAECLRLGADDTMPKPYTSQNFRDMLRKWTEGRRQDRLAS
jgi:two-component system sensor histidine kinase BarA